VGPDHQDHPGLRLSALAGLLFLAAVLALSCVLTVIPGQHGPLTQATSTATHARASTMIQKVSAGVDLSTCPSAPPWPGQAAAWLAVTVWVLRLLGWAFAVLFVAGFTSAARKT
jgi:hypothetical protein